MHADDGKTVVAGLFEGKCLFYDVTVEKKKIEDMRGRSIVNIKSSRGKNAKVPPSLSLCLSLSPRLYSLSLSNSLFPILFSSRMKPITRLHFPRSFAPNPLDTFLLEVFVSTPQVLSLSPSLAWFVLHCNVSKMSISEMWMPSALLCALEC